MSKWCLPSAVVVVVLLVTGSLAVGMAGSATHDEQAAPQAMLLPGDSAPSVSISEWLQGGDYDDVVPVKGRLITVIDFWGSWDPLSRAVLPSQNELQAELKGKGVRFLAIAEEPPEDTQAYLSQAKIRHLAVVSDPEAKVFRSYFGVEIERPFPFSVIVDECAPADGGRILWLGPVVNDSDSWARCAGYQDDLDAALKKVMAGDVDLTAARAAEARRLEFYNLVAAAQWYAQLGHLDKALAAAREMQKRPWPKELARMRQDASTTLAFFLADHALQSAQQAGSQESSTTVHLFLSLLADPSRKEYAELALALAKTARDLAGQDDAVLLHVYARAQAACGDVKGALDTQRRAAQAPRPQGQYLQLYWASEDNILDSLADYENLSVGKLRSDSPGPSVAPGYLSADQAVADLKQLQNILRMYHPAYDDAAWLLAATGSSWEKRTEEFAERLQSQFGEERMVTEDGRTIPPEYRCFEFQSMVTDQYLAVIADEHTQTAVSIKDSNGKVVTNLRRPALSQPPYFTDVRVREAGGKFTIAEAPDDLSSWLGAEVIGVPIIGSPAAAEPRRAYLFPTLPRAEAKGAKEYLLGFLSGPLLQKPWTPPKTLTTAVRSATGERQPELPVHRGRTALDKSQQRPPWTLREGSPPVLEVRTMNPQKLEGLPATADRLQKTPLLVLDLRANGGGSDLPGMEWCARLTSYTVEDPNGFCNIRFGATDPLRRWNSSFGFNWLGRLRPTRSGDAGEPFGGQLVVLADNGTGSAGEGFVRLASRVPGALVVGENTAGCETYGNQSQRFVLDNSKMEIRFGCSKGVYAQWPVQDGMGYFPRYWLDTDDPVKAIIDYVSAR